MKNSLFIFSLLSGTVLLCPDILIASDISTHTHTDTPGLKPASFIDMAHSYKTAAVCFMGYGDCDRNQKYNKGDDYSRDPETMCKEEGYLKTSCTLPAFPDGVCPYNNAYYAKCTDDKPRACRENGYPTLSCDTGEVVDTSCPYDSSYKKCKCDPCDGYDYTYAQATAQGYVTDGSCRSCSETKYRRKANPCAGYSTCECGGETGAAVCYSGSAQKFNSCKPCCKEACPYSSGGYGCSGEYERSYVSTNSCGNLCYACCRSFLSSVSVFTGCYCQPGLYPGHSNLIYTKTITYYDSYGNITRSYDTTQNNSNYGTDETCEGWLRDWSSCTSPETFESYQKSCY